MIPSVVLNLSQASITQFLDNSLSHSWSLILSEWLQYKGKDENKSAISFCLENLQKVWHCVIWGEKSLALAAMVYIFRCIMKIFPSRPCMRIELCWFNVSPGRIYTTQLPPAIICLSGPLEVMVASFLFYMIIPFLLLFQVIIFVNQVKSWYKAPKLLTRLILCSCYKRHYTIQIVLLRSDWI